MAKQNAQHRCTTCGHITVKWAGCCPECKTWNSLEPYNATAHNAGNTNIPTASVVPLNELSSSNGDQRYQTGMREWDRVMGEGGLMPGAFLIVTGDPGIGKSTLLLQVAAALAEKHTVLYFSSEESGSQLKQRGIRLGVTSSPRLRFSDCADLTTIIATAQAEKPAILIIDSIQNCIVQEEERQTTPGSVNHLKYAGFLLMTLAKKHTITVIVTGHITKEGQMAGPKLLEHIVDGVFYLQGEDRWQVRMLRGVKNRFGTIDELGFFEMAPGGLQPVQNINAHLLSQATYAPGSALTCSI